MVEATLSTDDSAMGRLTQADLGMFRGALNNRVLNYLSRILVPIVGVSAASGRNLSLFNVAR